jgi:hypothetical protein
MPEMTLQLALLYLQAKERLHSAAAVINQSEAKEATLALMVCPD